MSKLTLELMNRLGADLGELMRAYQQRKTRFREQEDLGRMISQIRPDLLAPREQAIDPETEQIYAPEKAGRYYRTQASPTLQKIQLMKTLLGDKDIDKELDRARKKQLYEKTQIEIKRKTKEQMQKDIDRIKKILSDDVLQQNLNTVQKTNFELKLKQLESDYEKKYGTGMGYRLNIGKYGKGKTVKKTVKQPRISEAEARKQFE
jgi:hypothetical protein